MQQKFSLKLLPSEAADESAVKRLIANTTGKKTGSVSGFHILKQSIDARAKTIWVNITVNAFIDEPFIERKIQPFSFKDVKKTVKRVVIIGAGPAGLFAALHLISARKRQGLGPVWDSIAQAHRAAHCKMSTPVLTRLLLEAVQFQTPKKTGMYRPKLRYAHQGGMNPPIIIVHGNSLEHVSESYKRYLEGRFRKEFDLVGTPMRIQMKTSHNPFTDKESK